MEWNLIKIAPGSFGGIVKKELEIIAPSYDPEAVVIVGCLGGIIATCAGYRERNRDMLVSGLTATVINCGAAAISYFASGNIAAGSFTVPVATGALSTLVSAMVLPRRNIKYSAMPLGLTVFYLAYPAVMATFRNGTDKLIDNFFSGLFG